MSTRLFNSDERIAALEPVAVSELADPQYIDDGHVQMSIAISLKRIADTLNEPNEYGEFGIRALANSIARDSIRNYFADRAALKEPESND